MAGSKGGSTRLEARTTCECRAAWVGFACGSTGLERLRDALGSGSHACTTGDETRLGMGSRAQLEAKVDGVGLDDHGSTPRGWLEIGDFRATGTTDADRDFNGAGKDATKSKAYAAWMSVAAVDGEKRGGGGEARVRVCRWRGKLGFL
ncbi:hypothetical protein E5676_scaffold504G00400 [Cucumis melo var. makuwa]|uniref:Uncharacterized protein n=1 Tax=Cucumis melo var. makuwa TaxID=1194695 RepID=A0A5D3CGH9_CUCMM|nr:hypothetical protein E6C27_scaffold81G00310 [Cucumis melo var. makuwa]TYK09409.1 hypothetical protein E5676_scaffold504G00400 [Cucumis melo var. makuwa]